MRSLSRNYQEHHSVNLRRSRDALSNVMLSLESALERMVGDDWIDGQALLTEITEDIAPRLSALRGRANDRYDDLTRHDDFDDMRTGKVPYPDERVEVPDLEPDPIPASTAAPQDPPPRPLGGPNAHRGQMLVEAYGSVDDALLALSGPDLECVQAHLYTQGIRNGWTPPVINPQT